MTCRPKLEFITLTQIYGLGKFTTVFQSEVLYYQKSTDIVKESEVLERRTSMYSDRQAALIALFIENKMKKVEYKANNTTLAYVYDMTGHSSVF